MLKTITLQEAVTICLLLRSSCGMAPYVPHSWLLVTLLWLLKIYLSYHNKRGNIHSGLQQPLLHTVPAVMQTDFCFLRKRISNYNSGHQGCITLSLSCTHEVDIPGVIESAPRRAARRPASEVLDPIRDQDWPLSLGVPHGGLYLHILLVESQCTMSLTMR